MMVAESLKRLDNQRIYSWPLPIILCTGRHPAWYNGGKNALARGSISWQRPGTTGLGCSVHLHRLVAIPMNSNGHHVNTLSLLELEDLAKMGWNLEVTRCGLVYLI
ncbi:hypothetical protein PAXRUDRAFT_633723 [Paxillus rubicundulus Ve08.2h10]|uniref:Uncharacterized protein n=1 Tax=Paxillus rubicundulus Ve08.2h10 TaxID=930991 RepID=A0A0D0D4D1_9AGAM|nr:hypothetical protein PAXRUDRAFT_633723 [Paxillus rubicundulus Ve08.2h10]